MNKIIVLLIGSILMLSLVACGNTSIDGQPPASQTDGTQVSVSGIPGLENQDPDLYQPDPSRASNSVPEPVFQAPHESTVVFYDATGTHPLPNPIVFDQYYSCSGDMFVESTMTLLQNADYSYEVPNNTQNGITIYRYSDDIVIRGIINTNEYGRGYACDEMNRTDNVAIGVAGLRTTYKVNEEKELTASSYWNYDGETYIDVRLRVYSIDDEGIPWMEIDNAPVILENYCSDMLLYIQNNLTVELGDELTGEEFRAREFPAIYTEYDGVGIDGLVQVSLDASRIKLRRLNTSHYAYFADLYFFILGDGYRDDSEPGDKKSIGLYEQYGKYRDNTFESINKGYYDEVTIKGVSLYRWSDNQYYYVSGDRLLTINFLHMDIEEAMSYLTII